MYTSRDIYLKYQVLQKQNLLTLIFFNDTQKILITTRFAQCCTLHARGRHLYAVHKEHLISNLGSGTTCAIYFISPTEYFYNIMNHVTELCDKHSTYHKCTIK